MDLELCKVNCVSPIGTLGGSFTVKDGRIASLPQGEAVSGGLYVFPGFADVHVHLREPGFSYKETVASGTRAAAHGGYTALCAMPNLNPVPDSPEHLGEELEIIRRDAVVQVLPYGAITQGQKGRILADLAGMASRVAGFSDDGKGVQDPAMMRRAMEAAKALEKPIVAHCEDESLIRGGIIHDGAYANAHGLPGICSESEWGPIARDLELAFETGCAYHVCHISTRESVKLIRQAKARGLDVTCETAPHYLLLDDSMLRDEGSFRMNPPIREKADREALWEGLRDGTIDMIATDHAPHSAREKAGGLKNSLNGIVGLETAFPVLYTGLVKTGIISLPRLVELLSDAPRRRFGLGSPLEVGAAASFTVFDLDQAFPIDPAAFLSQGCSTPFAGWEVSGRCLMTVYQGKIVWQEKGWDAS